MVGHAVCELYSAGCSEWEESWQDISLQFLKFKVIFCYSRVVKPSIQSLTSGHSCWIWIHPLLTVCQSRWIITLFALGVTVLKQARKWWTVLSSVWKTVPRDRYHWNLPTGKDIEASIVSELLFEKLYSDDLIGWNVKMLSVICSIVKAV